MVTEVVRLDDERDAAGDPIYVLKATLITAVGAGIAGEAAPDADSASRYRPSTLPAR